MNRLMIGSGLEAATYRRQGYTVLDAERSTRPDIIATVPPLPTSVEKKSWELVEAVHFIEHLYREDALKLVEEIHAVLSDGGRLVLEQANLEYVCRVILGEIAPPVSKYPWMEGEPAWFGILNLYPQPDMIGGNEFNHHLYGYTPETLTDLVVEAGFERSKIETTRSRSHVVERDFRLEGVK